MIDVYHLPKRHPDAGRFRIWSLLARPDLAERTVGRVMVRNKQVYDDIPHGGTSTKRVKFQLRAVRCIFRTPLESLILFYLFLEPYIL